MNEKGGQCPPFSCNLSPFTFGFWWRLIHPAFLSLFRLPFEVGSNLVIAQVKLARIPIPIRQEITVYPKPGRLHFAATKLRGLLLPPHHFHYRHRLRLRRWADRASRQQKLHQAEE